MSARVARADPPPARPRMPSSDVGGRLARGAAAQVLVLADDDLVERPGGERPVLALVLVAPVARDAEDADGAAGSRPDPTAPIRPALVCGSTIIRPTKSASWRIPSTLWQ